MKTKKNICGIIIGLLGLSLLTLGIISFIYVPMMIKSYVFDALMDLMHEDSEQYANFIKPPVPVYMKFMMYHVLNPDEIVKGAKPNISEIGPFVYRVYRKKVKIKRPDKCSIQYAQYKRYRFDMKKTKEMCEECQHANQTYFTAINAAYVGLQQVLREGFDGIGDLSGLIDGVSCAVRYGKWNAESPIMIHVKYPECKNTSPGWNQYKDSLFINTTVDKFLFGGYTSGTLRLLKDELNGRWKKALGSLIKIPYAIQPLENGELAFGAMKTKNGTIRHEHFEIDTGQCPPKPGDSWWITTSKENSMINYLQIKKWGPTRDRLASYVRADTLCRSFDDVCFGDPSSGSPYGDYGWWKQNNGHRCPKKQKPYRPYCHKNDTSTNSLTRLSHNNICNWVRGTDGQQFHPYVTREDRLWIFQKDICRSVFMEYQNDEDFMGFQTLKFVMPQDVFKVETELNLGFCKEIQRGAKDGSKTRKVPWNRCTKIKSDSLNPEMRILDISRCRKSKGYDRSHDCIDGVMDISKCTEGSALVISQPHFYQADEKLWKMFDGITDPMLHPDRYETYILVEPHTGASLSGHARMQFNIRLNRQSNVAYLTNLWEDYSLFPMMWIEEFAELDEKYKVKLDHMLADPLMGIFVAQWALVGCGALLLFVLTITMCVCK